MLRSPKIVTDKSLRQELAAGDLPNKFTEFAINLVPTDNNKRLGANPTVAL